MSAGRAGKSHAIAWALAFFAVPVLYVLTLPPIVFFAATHFSRSEKMAGIMPTYIGPYNWLTAHAPLQRSLVSYMEFWRLRFGYDPNMPHDAPPQ